MRENSASCGLTVRLGVETRVGGRGSVREVMAVALLVLLSTREIVYRSMDTIGKLRRVQQVTRYEAD